MVKRIRIRGFKSLHDLDLELPPLAVLLGPNAAGKSNFLDALQLLARLGTSRTLHEAFSPPYRGKAIESFAISEGGLQGLCEKDCLTFSLEADLSLSDSVVDSINREIDRRRHPAKGSSSARSGKAQARVRERNLRYRIEIQMAPKSGILWVKDEYLAALNSNRQPTRNRKAFLEKRGEKLHLRLEGQSQPTYYERYLDQTILSIPHYAPHYPHLVAARRELESWQFFYFEPRERMRAANPVQEVTRLGSMGEGLAAFLRTIQVLKPREFDGIERSLRMLVPSIDSIEFNVTNLGEVELFVRENGVSISARFLSEGTLRILGLLALSGAKETPSLVGFEEPENGVNLSRIELIAELLKTQKALGHTQYVVTTHSSILPDFLPKEFWFVTQRMKRCTRIAPLASGSAVLGTGQIHQDVEGFQEDLPVSKRILRGDFDA